MSAPWNTAARDALEDLIARGERFTADDLADIVGQPDTNHSPNGANNGIGHVFAEASAAGRIVAVGVERSRAPRRKSGLIRVWIRADPPKGEGRHR